VTTHILVHDDANTVGVAVVEGIAGTGKKVEGFAIERFGDLKTIERASRVVQQFVQQDSEKQREACPISDLSVSTKCGESDTTSGLASNPTVGNLIDKVEPMGVTTCFGETTEITGAEMLCKAREMSEHVDLDVSRLLRREMNLDEAGDALLEITLRTANGRLTCAESLGHCEFVMTKLYPSA
jgi:(2R)-sulfolactate sulfo-lyase subunit beta